MKPLKKQSYIGSEINSLAQDDLRGMLCFLQKDKDAFSFQQFQFISAEWAQFIDQIKDYNQIVFIINTPDVLTKTVESGQNFTQTDLFHQILPTEQENQYYIQTIDGANHSVHVSLIKRSVIDSFVDSLINSQIFPRAIFIGDVILQPLIPLLNINHSLHTTFTTHDLNDQNLIKDSQPNNSLEKLNILSEETIRANELLALSAALYAIYPTDLITPIHYTRENEVLEDNTYKKRLYQLLWIGGSVLLLTLLFNFFLFNSLNNDNSQLVRQSDEYQSQIQIIKNYNNRLKEEQAVIKENPWLINSRTSFYCDRIMSVKPVAAQLSETSLFPIKDEKDLTFINNEIKIIGQTKDNRSLNSWMNSLKQFDWVDFVEIEQLKESDQGINQFHLKIILK